MKGKLKKVSIDGKDYFQNSNTGKLYGEPRIIVTRKIARNALKKVNGNNKIRRSWREYQIENYGVSKWCRMYNKSCCNNKVAYVTPQDAMNI